MAFEHSRKPTVLVVRSVRGVDGDLLPGGRGYLIFGALLDGTGLLQGVLGAVRC